MACHSTNYFNSFIQVSPDCPASQGQVPPQAEPPSLARMQVDLILPAPYQHTSDEVIFRCHAAKQGLAAAEWPAARERFFSKSQPCLRSSPLVKRYGWGIHSDAQGRVALVGRETEEYQRLAADPHLRQLFGMRSQRAGT